MILCVSPDKQMAILPLYDSDDSVLIVAFRSM
jgi:hypothetical protein